MVFQLVVDSEVFRGFAFYAAIVLAKTMVMSFITGTTRMKKKVFSNPEDAKIPGAKIKFDDVDIERVRRCHLNDLENVYLFVLAGLFYCFTKPNPAIALWHFRAFAIARVTHTFVYLLQVPQPSRALAFVVGVVSCTSMLVQTLMATF